MVSVLAVLPEGDPKPWKPPDSPEYAEWASRLFRMRRRATVTLEQGRTGRYRPIIPTVKILWTAFFAVSLQVADATRNNQVYGITLIIPHAE